MRFVLWLIVGLLFCSSAHSKEIPIDIKADNLRFFEDTGMVEASGSVEVKFEGATIYSDRLRMDSSADVATADGNVKVFSGGYSANAQQLTYDAGRGTTVFYGFSSELQPKKLRGKLFLRSEKLVDLKNKMQGGPGTLTTCDYRHPHYFLSSGRVDYYPDDRIEGRDDKFFVGDIPVMWLPFLYYDLKGQRDKNWVFGHNEVEGDYVKSSWAYPAGFFLLDYMEKKGIGFGVDNAYALGALGLGSLYLYQLGERDTGEQTWVEKISHTKQLGPAASLRLDHSYIDTYRLPSGRIDQTAFGLELNRSDKENLRLRLDALDDRAGLYQKYALSFGRSYEKSRLDYYYNYEFAKNDPRWMRNSQRLSFHRPVLSDRVNFGATANYYHSAAGAGDSGEERIEPQIEFSGAEKDFSWRYSQNWFTDLRAYLSPGTPRYEFLEKQPEIEIYPRMLDLKLFDLQSTFGYGRYRESKRVPDLGGNRDYSTERYRASLNANKRVPLGLSLLLLGAGVDQFLYGPGDQLYALRENASLQTNPSSFFRNDLDFRHGYTEGNTPFFFDQLGTRYHDLREKMTFYYLDQFNWTIDGGYNWQTSKYFDVMTNLTVSPDRRLRLRLGSGWDIENRRYKDLIAGLKMVPHGFYSLDFNFAQDMNAGELRYASALHDLYFWQGAPNQMNLRFSQVFDPVARDFKVRDIMIVKDLHCWEMRYTYSDYRKEVSLSFILKALPGEPVGFSTGRGFYYEGFEEQLREIKGEGEVRRY